MKLGTETGSLFNHIMAVSKQPKPVVGMGCTILSWTDRHPATIVWVSDSGAEVKIQEDRARRTDDNGLSECQTYEYSPNPQASGRSTRLVS